MKCVRCEFDRKKICENADLCRFNYYGPPKKKTELEWQKKSAKINCIWLRTIISTSLKINISRANKLAIFSRLFLYYYNLFSCIFISRNSFFGKKIAVFSHIEFHILPTREKRYMRKEDSIAHTQWGHHHFFGCRTHPHIFQFRMKNPKTYKHSYTQKDYSTFTVSFVHIERTPSRMWCVLKNYGFQCEKDVTNSFSPSHSVRLGNA